jgi:hypothetical protein
MALVERYEGLEPTAENFKRILGDAGARALAEAFGGLRLYVPRQPGAHHPITVALGHEGAAQLAAAFGSDQIDIPMLPNKQAEIRRLAGEGLTRREIAVKVRCTQRWVYKTLEDGETSPPAQGDMFG